MAQRVFLDWSRPLPDGLTEWLAAGWEPGGGPLDLSDTVVVVPTAGAGRILRETLALWAGEREAGVLSPTVVTPEVLITWGMEASASAADRGELVAAWASVLAELDLNEWRPLFPVDPVSQDLSWAMSAAADLLKLRRTLEEGGRDLRMAAATLGPENPEADRWEGLAALEERAVERLEAGGWRDPVAARLAAARATVLPDGVRRLVVAGVPDSILLTRTALESIDSRNLVELTVAIHAPAALAEAFDAWGRPRPGIWGQREIRLPKGNDSITLTARPEDAAAILMAKLVSAKAQPAGLVIGSADQEVSAPLRRLASAEGIEVFDPEGLPLLEHELSWLMKTLTRLLHSGAWSAAGQLLRLPEVLSAAARACGGGNEMRLLEEWDVFQKERLPRNLTQGAALATGWSEETLADSQKRSTSPEDLKLSALPRVINWLLGLLTKFRSSALPDSLTDFLETVYNGKRFASGAERQRFVAALSAWQEAVASVEKGAAAFLPRLSAAARLDLAASLVRDARLYTAHRDEAQALHGWLELPWQEAPDLIIAGMNEGMVPDSVLGDAWLPDSVRAALDLKTNETRLARDSYLLTAMIESRRAGGSVRLIAGRMSAAGDPLKPSRLLLRCPAADLPERALHLFPREIADSSGRPPAAAWQRAWKLQVPPPRENAAIFERLSVTAFSDYLKCPFRFYLRHVLRMEEYDASQAELDARTVGTLFHNTMEDFHKEPSLRDSQEAAVIRAFLHGRFDERVQEIYGNSLTIPVVMQLEVIRNCLAKAAEIHAEESGKGWRFKEVELAFPKLVTIKGTEIRGRIDLIQQHPEQGYRILDYKTSSKAVKPVDAHLKSVRSKAEQERRRDLPNASWATMDHGGKFYAWQNLQLPLYARIMAAHYDVEAVQVGYINLPRAVSESRLEVWENLDSSLLESAWACAEGVIDCVRKGIFWPPAAAVKYDDFESLIFQDAESSFDPAKLQRVESMIASGEFRPAAAQP